MPMAIRLIRLGALGQLRRLCSATSPHSGLPIGAATATAIAAAAVRKRMEIDPRMAYGVRGARRRALKLQVVIRFVAFLFLCCFA